jgi:hypothetical protein
MSHSAALPESKAGWEHFPHDADVGVRGWGTSAAQAFEQAAYALTAVIKWRSSRRSWSRSGVRRPTSNSYWSNGSTPSSTRWRSGKCCLGASRCGSMADGSKGGCGASRSMSSAMRASLRAERGNLYGSEGRQEPRWHLVFRLHRGRLAENDHGSCAFHSGRPYDVADRAAWRHAGAGHYLRRRKPHPRHG